jgi:transposase
MKITTVGIDLAKNVFAVHGVNEHGRTVLKKVLKRNHVAEFFANLPACVIGMEACASAHYWARKLQAMGHTVRLIAPQFVKPYVKTNKNDAADAEAICEAVARPNMRFVPVKSIEQQSVLSLHRVRQGFVRARTAQANQVRGLLAEFGIVVPKGIGYLERQVPELIEDAENELTGSFRLLIQRLMDHLKELDRQVRELEAQIQAWHRSDEMSRRLARVPGIGPLTASALVASVGDAKSFGSGRQLAAWLGLVPRQNSSGGKNVLLSISKRGDVYCEHCSSTARAPCCRLPNARNARVAGCMACCSGETRMSLRSHSRTRTRGSSGRYWSTAESFILITTRLRRPRSRQLARLPRN